MTILIGGFTPPHLSKNNHIIGSDEHDIIFGDPFTEGNIDNLPPPPDSPGGVLSSGRGGNDWLEGLADRDFINGDAGLIAETGRGGNDRIEGGDGDDFISGDSESDITDDGRGGNDLILGGGERDLIVGDAWSTMRDGARGGNDRILGGDGGDSLYGDADGLTGGARGGDDQLLGEAGDDNLLGDGGLSGDAKGGDDLVQGGDGNDELYGEGGVLSDAARGGDDRLSGGVGNDLIYGDGQAFFFGAIFSGRDLLDGGEGNDALYGDTQTIVGTTGVVCADDVLAGGAGDDLLFGDADPSQIFDSDNNPADLAGVTRGADRFVFATGSGQDTIGDFETGHDLVDIKKGYKAIKSFDQITDNAEEVDGSTVIDLGAAAGGTAGVDTLTLTNVALADLTAADFGLR